MTFAPNVIPPAYLLSVNRRCKANVFSQTHKYLRERQRIVRDCCDDAEIVQAALHKTQRNSVQVDHSTYLQREEEIWVACVRNMDNLAGWKDKIVRHDLIHCQAVLSRDPREAATEAEASHA